MKIVYEMISKCKNITAKAFEPKTVNLRQAFEVVTNHALKLFFIG